MKFLYLLLLGIVLWSCSSLKMNKASDVSEIKGNTIVYQLPQNQVELSIELEKTTFIPGPYSEYSKTYLEIEPLQDQLSEAWQISNIQIEIVAVSDTNHVYLLSGATNKIAVSNLMQLSNSQKNISNNNVVNNSSDHSNYLPYYTELTLRKLIIEDSKTSYKTVTVDSISKRIPIVNVVVRNKTMEELAKDAAKTLAKIRKRKFRLMAGMDTNLPKQGNLKLMFDELDKKEKQYLELFMGKTITEVQTVSVSVLPTEYKKHMLFYFDKSKGLIADKTKGTPLWLNIEPISSAPKLDISSKYTNTEKLLPYRIPEQVKLSIEQDDKKIFKANSQLAQFGQISYLSLDVLKDSNLKLDAKTGALIGIE